MGGPAVGWRPENVNRLLEHFGERFDVDEL
jgi:hypothetical protein